jgi:DNA (cytosine-5)-methyltransferase 1
MLRVIRELAPRWVIGENVPGILRIAGDTICQDLELEGYDVGIFNYEAAAVGAPHRRERVFFVGRVMENAANVGREQPGVLPQQPGRTESVSAGESGADWPRAEMSTDEANTDNAGLQGRKRGLLQECTSELPVGPGGTYLADTHSTMRKFAVEHKNTAGRTGLADGDQRAAQSRLGMLADGIPSGVAGNLTFPPEPDVPRVATGVKDRVDKLKALGNAVVWYQAYPIFAAIAETERTDT